MNDDAAGALSERADAEGGDRQRLDDRRLARHRRAQGHARRRAATSWSRRSRRSTTSKEYTDFMAQPRLRRRLRGRRRVRQVHGQVRRRPRRDDEGRRHRQVAAMKLNDARLSARAVRCCSALRDRSWHVAGLSAHPGPEGRPGAVPGAHRRRRCASAALILMRAAAGASRAPARGAGSTRPTWLRSPRHVLALRVLVARHRVLPARGRHARLPPHRDRLLLAALMWVLRRVARGWRVPVALRRDARRSTSRSTSCCACRCPGACCSASRGDDDAHEPGTRRRRFALVFDPYNVARHDLVASLFGLFVGAVPGLTATMATALLVPVTFFMAPIPAIAAIVTATAMAIFSGDIPGCLLRMPGTPASAAYTDEAYAMTKQGPGRDRARRRPRVLGGRRPVRHRGADRRGAGAGRVRAQVQLVRVLLAGAAGPDLRGLHLDRRGR